MARQAKRQAKTTSHPPPAKVQKDVTPEYIKGLRAISQGKALTRLLMMPSESPLIRVPTRGMGDVAICKFREYSTFTERGGREDFGGTTYTAVLYGQPGLTHVDGPHIYGSDATFPIGFYQPAGEFKALAAPATWEWNLQVPTGGVSTTELHTMDLDSFWPVSYCQSSQPHIYNKFRPLMVVDGLSYVWLNVGEELQVVGGKVFGGGSGQVELEVYKLAEEDSGPVLVSDQSVTWSNGNIVADSLKWQTSGWHAVKVNRIHLISGTISSVSLNISILAKVGYPYWKLHYSEEIASNPHVGQAARRTACSLLLSNRSAALVAQGDIIATRLPARPLGCADTAWIWSQVAESQKVYDGNASRGCYTYMEFSEEDEIFRDCVNTWGSPIAHRPEGTMMNVITVKNAGAVNTFAIITHIVVEFKTNSQLFPMAVPTLKGDELEDARRINNMTLYFYENDLHWKDLERYISKMWDWTRRNATLLGTAGSLLFPEAAPIIMPISRVLQN